MDPDRFLDYSTPGAQEWWYFDAISDDGRDALVLVWYAALPFDPSYGVAALKHLKSPDRHPAPRALDHCAVGLSLYRDEKPVAYALNGFREPDFQHTSSPFSVTIAGNRLARDDEGYSLEIDTPAVDGRTALSARLRFRPAAGTTPLERDLGSEESPHVWILAAADGLMQGEVRIGEKLLEFRGRGYHDHNAGSEEISRAMKRWRWGRAHHGPFTEVYYLAEPHRGEPQSLWITCRDGRPEAVREGVVSTEEDPRRNVFGLKESRTMRLEAPSGGTGETMTRTHRSCVDDGPFYQRWISDFRGGSPEWGGPEGVPGIGEVLATGNLNRPLFNWMIPFRLKRPKNSGRPVS